ncbi:MAG: phosphate signaling complex protein PhoU [Anaerolineales bacterium]
MPRKTLDQEIQIIREDMLLLGNMVEQALIGAVVALKDHDIEKSRSIRDQDKTINTKRFDVEGQIIVTIATQSPTARDLRFLASCLNLCTELERIGDYAKAIANANIRSGGINIPALLVITKKMGLKTADMLHRAMSAFIQADAAMARNIIFEDDVVDSYYSNLYEASIQRMIADARMMQRINYVLWAAHSLERAADRVTNICERTIYIETGELIQAEDIL